MVPSGHQPCSSRRAAGPCWERWQLLGEGQRICAWSLCLVSAVSTTPECWNTLHNVCLDLQSDESTLVVKSQFADFGPSELTENHIVYMRHTVKKIVG